MKKTSTTLIAGAIAALTVGCAANAQVHSSHSGASTTASSTSAVSDRHNIRFVNNDGQQIGTAILTQGPNGLLMKIEVSGLTPGWHGIHLHETAQCEGAFTSAGAHVNHSANKAPHGLLNADGPDNGDLPNIYAHADGSAKAEIFTTLASLSGLEGTHNLLDSDGSAIVIHASADDHASQPIGGAGARVGCGVIQLF